MIFCLTYRPISKRSNCCCSTCCTPIAFFYLVPICILSFNSSDSVLSFAFFHAYLNSFSVIPESRISPYNSGFRVDKFRPRSKKIILLLKSSKSKGNSCFASRITVLKGSGLPAESISLFNTNCSYNKTL